MRCLRLDHTHVVLMQSQNMSMQRMQALHLFSQPIITLKFVHVLWQYYIALARSHSRTVNIRFLRLLTVRAHGQYNHRWHSMPICNQ